MSRARSSRPGDAAAIGIANQGETVVAWDADTKRPIHNAIVWQDARTADVTERLKADGAEELTLKRRRPAARSLFLRRQAALAARQRAGSDSAAPSAGACASAPAMPSSSTA